MPLIDAVIGEGEINTEKYISPKSGKTRFSFSVIGEGLFKR